MKKVLIITYYWPPAGGAPVQRWLKLAKYLTRNNVEPIVITVDENKAGYPVLDPSLKEEIPASLRIYPTNTWEPFEIYRRIMGKKISQTGFIDDQKPSLMEKMMRFIRGNFFIPDARVGWNHFAYKQCKKIIECEHIDAVITNSPPHSSQLIGYKLKKKFNIPWIADFRDPWTDIHYYPLMYHTRLAKIIDARMERKVLLNADKVIVVSEGMKQLFEDKLKGVKKDILVVPNGYDDEDFQIDVRPPSDKFVITHSGSISEKFDIGRFVNAVSKFKTAKPEIPLSIRFIGNMDKKIFGLFENAGIVDLLDIKPFQPHKEVPVILKSSAVLFMSIINTPNNKGLISAKFFEYLASGVPIICLAPQGADVGKIIHESNSGQCFDYSDEDGIFNYLNQLAEQWKQNPVLRVTSNEGRDLYSRAKQAEFLAKLI
jgi:glycosyltransferase involved in cell wall biosynthesis